jgi:TIR domain
MPSIAGFWSYAHVDDENDEGRILALARRLEAEYELLTAERLELFIDESTLMWGDDWRERIAAALERVTFFIPVITPTYFRRPECRKELLRFAREARERKAEKLILPIYYVEVPELESDVPPADEAMAAVKPFQREDLRRLRLKNQDGAAYRRLVNGLAHRLISIAREAEEVDGAAPAGGSRVKLGGPPPQPPAPATPAPSELEADEPETFFLEEMAKGEEALEGLQGPLEAMGADIRTLGSLSEEAAREMATADEAGKPGFASRLAIARQLASRLEEPARSMERNAQEYVSRLWDVDPLVHQMLDWALERDGDDEEEVENKEDFLKTILELAETTSGAQESTSELLRSLEENTNFSRDLRQPLRVFQTNLRNIIDAQSLIEQWARRAEGAERAKPESSAGDSLPEADEKND